MEQKNVILQGTLKNERVSWECGLAMSSVSPVFHTVKVSDMNTLVDSL